MPIESLKASFFQIPHEIAKLYVQVLCYTNK